MLLADKYRLVPQNLRIRAATPVAEDRRSQLLSLVRKFDDIAVAAEKEDWSDIDFPPSIGA